LIKGSGSLSAAQLGLRMRVEATPGLVGGGILESINYAAHLTHEHSVDQWEWDEEWTHNSGRARQDMQDRSESRKRSSDVGLEDRRVAATVVSGLRQRTTMIPAVVRDATSSPLDHIEISVFYTSPGKKVLKREPTGTHRDWGYLDIPSLISWNYDLLSPVKITVEMAVEATNVAPINRLIRSRFAVIGKMKAHLPTSSRSNKMSLEVTGETLKAGPY